MIMPSFIPLLIIIMIAFVLYGVDRLIDILDALGVDSLAKAITAIVKWLSQFN